MECRPVRTFSEPCAAFTMVHDNYVASGYMTPHSSGMGATQPCSCCLCPPRGSRYTAMRSSVPVRSLPTRQPDSPRVLYLRITSGRCEARAAQSPKRRSLLVVPTVKQMPSLLFVRSSAV